MSGYQTIEAIRAIPPSAKTLTAVVAMDLVRPNGIPRRVKRAQGTPLTPEAIAYIQRRRAEQVGIRVIARELNCSQFSVCKYARGIKPKNGQWSRGGGVQRLNLAFAQRLRRAGFTFAEIAENLGCTESGAHRLLVPKRETPRGAIVSLTVEVQTIARITGIACRDLRKPLRGPERKYSYHVTKARHILIWYIKQRHPRLSVMKICRSLGGLSVSGALAGLRTAKALLAENDIAVGRYPGLVVSALWALDWPVISKSRPR